MRLRTVWLRFGNVRRRDPHAGYCQCGGLFHCKRGGSCILHTCRTGDLGCYHQGVQYTADRLPYVLALQMALVRGKISEEQCESYIKELKTLPDKIGRIIEDKERLQWFASKQANAKDIFLSEEGSIMPSALRAALR